jgi:hypothetical protein
MLATMGFPDRDDPRGLARTAGPPGFAARADDRSGDAEARAHDRILDALQGREASPRAPLRALVPADALADAPRLTELLGSVVAEYEEIERALAALRDETGDWEALAPGSAIAFVSEAELLDPVSLERALRPLQSETARFEFLFGQARAALQRLDGYRLSHRPPAEVVARLGEAEQLRHLQHVVEFLVSLQSAADSFEELELPGPHVRDYLEHLYRMKDWREMGRLVRLLELAVERCLRVQDPAAAATTDPKESSA